MASVLRQELALVDEVDVNVQKQGETPETHPWLCGSSFRFPIPNDDDPWEKCVTLMQTHDQEMCNAWKDELQKLLLFAGLFSAVVTSFTLESQKLLQHDTDPSTLLLVQTLAQLGTMLNQNSTTTFPNPTQLANSSVFVPSTISIRINILWFVSLTLGLATVLLGTLCLQWIREFERRDLRLHYKEAVSYRQLRYRGLTKWRVPGILSSLPLLLQAALVLFFVGLIEYLRVKNHKVALAVAAIVGPSLFFLLVTTMLPALYTVLYVPFQEKGMAAPPCPYKSPQSWVFLQVVLFIVSLKRICLGKVQGSHFLPTSFKRLSAYQSFWNELLVPLTEARNWSHHDRLLQVRCFDDFSTGLAWIGRTFVECGDTIQILYHALQDLDPLAAWKSCWSLIHGERHPGSIPDVIGNENPKRPEYIHELALASVLHHLVDQNQEDESDASLALHRLELFIRSMTDTQHERKDHRTRPVCPKINWLDMRSRDGDYINILDNFRLRLINSFTTLLEEDVDGTINGENMSAIWGLISSLLHSPLPDPFDNTVALDQIFAAIDRWVKQLEVAAHQKQGQKAMFVFCLTENFLIPAYHRETKQHMHPNLVTLADIQPFVRVANHLKTNPGIVQSFMLDVRSRDCWQNFLVDPRFSRVFESDPSQSHSGS